MLAHGALGVAESTLASECSVSESWLRWAWRELERSTHARPSKKPMLQTYLAGAAIGPPQPLQGGETGQIKGQFYKNCHSDNDGNWTPLLTGQGVT